MAHGEHGPFSEVELTQSGHDDAAYLRTIFMALKTGLENVLPPSRHASLVQTKLEEAFHWALAGVAAKPGNSK